MEKAVKCSGKRCKAVFHINEHRELGGINDKGYIVEESKNPKSGIRGTGTFIHNIFPHICSNKSRKWVA